MSDEKNFDLISPGKKPHASVQWSDTFLCMDFYCDCGAHCRFEDYSAYCVKCPHCKAMWEMPSRLFPRKADERTKETSIKYAKTLEPDEDHADLVDGGDGVTRLAARPVTQR